MQRARYLGSIFLLIFFVTLTAAGYFALQLRGSVAPPLAGPLSADKGYGVTIDLTQYDDGHLADTLTAIHDSGFTWLRQPVNWAEIEPEPGQFDWQALDRIFMAVSEKNRNIENSFNQLKLIVVLQTSPPWARPPNTQPATPPVEMSHFGNFIQEFARRYGPQIDYYQIWHEPNLSANWGDAFVDPDAYARMLREAAFNIRAVDPEAHILTAALAATLEEGPLNLNELTYLDQLYQARAQAWFDIVSLQPYGLWTKPLDAPTAQTLNFRRAELVRQVMLTHNDAGTPIWATAFGWVVLPTDWTGQPSPWSYDQAIVQAPRTAEAIAHARNDWPWLGPMLAARWDATGLAEDDPARGFALLETPAMLGVFQTAATKRTVATVGDYPANHPSGRYSPGWRFAQSRADIPREAPRTLTIPFEGNRLDLRVNRGLFRGFLWVTIDDRPANALPHDRQGRSYIVLYDPLREAETVTVAEHLSDAIHKARIEAEGGWEQWAIEGWAVSNRPDTRPMQTGLIFSLLLAALSGSATLWKVAPLLPQIVRWVWNWGEFLATTFAKIGERGHIVIGFTLALGLYLLPGWGAFLLLPFLALTTLLRPDVGLMLVVLSSFFFEIPIRLPLGAFSPVELALALTLFSFIVRGAFIVYLKHTLERPSSIFLNLQSLKSTDWAALALVILALVATIVAENFAVSFREWRIVVLESVIFYFLVRLGYDFGPPQKHLPNSRRWVWRLVDVFVIGASLQATVALYFYFFTDQTIDAEGVRRALGLAGGSPNNLALILGRAWPILLVVALLDRTHRYRRGLYGIGFVFISFALYFTFSKGALLLGLPACLAALTVLYGWHHYRQSRLKIAVAAGGSLILLGLALIPFSQTERFRTTLNFDDGGTTFFRLKLWQASWAMLQDHWLLGVGLDNFLYQYRTRYILPEAWQEPDLNHPHNLILDFGLRLGLGGLVILFWLQTTFWRNVWRLYNRKFDPLILGLMGSMIIFLSHGLVDNSYFLVDLAFAFFLIVGITQRLAELPPES